MRKQFTNKSSSWLKYVIAAVGLIAAYFFTRLINLTIIPIFTDEAIYLRWAQIALGDPRWRFISLIDGKQPLLIWLFLPALKIISDPLVAGRLVSVLMGSIALLGMVVFGWYLTKKARGGFIAGILYLVIPFFLHYDRLAIYEALFVAITVWTLFVSYLFAQKQRLDLALILGTAIGAGLLTKSYASFFLILLPLGLVFILKRGISRKVLFKWLGLVAIVFVQSQIYENIQRLSEFRHIIALKNLTFIYSFSEFFADPFQSVRGNGYGLYTWLVAYLTWPLLLLIISANVWLIRKDWRKGVFFLGFFLIPFATLAFFGRVIYPRFLMFMLPAFLLPLVIFIDHLLTRFKQALFWVFLFILILLPAFYFDFKLLTDPIRAPFPLVDRQQFINDWPAGYGIAEVVAYLKEEAKNGPIVVGTDGTFGLYPMALELYLGKDPNVIFKPYWPLNEFPKDLLEEAKSKPTFLLFKEKQEYPSDWPLVKISEYQRGDGPTYLKFFRVVPKT